MGMSERRRRGQEPSERRRRGQERRKLFALCLLPLAAASASCSAAPSSNVHAGTGGGSSSASTSASTSSSGSGATGCAELCATEAELECADAGTAADCVAGCQLAESAVTW